MRKLSHLEIFFVAIGSFLALVGAFLFFFKAERLGVYFGYLVESQKAAVGKLEYSIAGTKRKPPSAQNFISINNQQKVFDRDTVMTSGDNEAILSLSDGGSINLGPNSMVQLITREDNALGNGEPEMVLEIKQGTVTGLSGSSKIKVMQNGKIIDLAKPKPGSLLSNVMNQKKNEVSRKCNVRMGNPAEVIADPTRGVMAPLRMDCDDMYTGTSKLTITDMLGKEILKDQTVAFDSGVAQNLFVKFENPGSYTAIWNGLDRVEEPVVIPAEFSGINFESPALECGGRLRWKKTSVLPAAPDERYVLEVAGTGQSINVTGTMYDFPFDALSFPAKVRVKTAPRTDGFSWASQPLTLNSGAACNELISPPNEAKVKVARRGASVVFTWRQNPGQGAVRFQISRDSQLSQVLKSEQTTHNYIRLILPAEGEYYWRVIDLKSGERSRISSMILSFQRKR